MFTKYDTINHWQTGSNSKKIFVFCIKSCRIETENTNYFTILKKLERVYIIDDDEVIIYLTNKLIASVDFCETVETFLEAEVALEKLKTCLETGNELPDAILFDLNMPVMNGWQFIEAFQKLHGAKNIPCFVFTTSIDAADKNKALKYKIIKDFITKPLTHQKLDKILRQVDK